MFGSHPTNVHAVESLGELFPADIEYVAFRTVPRGRDSSSLVLPFFIVSIFLRR